MTDNNARKPFVLLSESELNDIANSFYSELTKMPIYDNSGRIEVIKNALQQTQSQIIKNIQNLNEQESMIVPELITIDILLIKT